MRLISQDGMIDVPYENTIINCEKNMADSYAIYAEASHCFSVAVYSTESKALKVMEMLREQYFDNKHEETYRDGVFNYAPNFKFPADEKVEV